MLTGGSYERERREHCSIKWPHQVKRLCVASGTSGFRACNLSFAECGVGLLIESCWTVFGLISWVSKDLVSETGSAIRTD